MPRVNGTDGIFLCTEEDIGHFEEVANGRLELVKLGLLPEPPDFDGEVRREVCKQRCAKEGLSLPKK